MNDILSNNSLQNKEFDSFYKTAKDIMFDLRLNYKLSQTESKHREEYRKEVFFLTCRLQAASKLLSIEANKNHN